MKSINIVSAKKYTLNIITPVQISTLLLIETINQQEINQQSINLVHPLSVFWCGSFDDYVRFLIT